MKKNKKNKKWIKFRHGVIRNILYGTLGVYTRIKYRIKIERFREQQKRPYLVLFNHQTAFDQFFVGMAFKGPVYYMASEDLFSNGFTSSLIRYLVAPIPIKKQTVDVRAIINCMSVAKEGGTIAIAPEGNRTFSGQTEYMNPSIAVLARKLGMPIALYRIEGGYGVHPRWSDVVRRGKMRGYVSEVIYPEEYETLTNEELSDRISQALYVNEAVADEEFHHPKLAEYLERAIYYCPHCGLSEFESCGDVIECKKCGSRVRYTPKKELEGINCDFPYRFVLDWYRAQADFTNKLNVTEYKEEPMYEDVVSLYEVVPYKNKRLISQNAKMTLFGNRIHIGMQNEDIIFSFDETSAVTILGKNKLDVYEGKKIYQIKGTKRFNALKYVHIYNRYKNIVKGEEDVKFLGL